MRVFKPLSVAFMTALIVTATPSCTSVASHPPTKSLSEKHTSTSAKSIPKPPPREKSLKDSLHILEKSYDSSLPMGGKVSKIFIEKSKRRLDLLNDEGVILKSYPIALGFNPKGDKKYEGDGRTPEGSYTIVRHNADSKFYLSLEISYPSAQDRLEAKKHGYRSAGGEIFVHGAPNYATWLDRWHTPENDWTHGCIALRNKDMKEIYTKVMDGTPIVIKP